MKNKIAIIGSGDLGLQIAHHVTSDSQYEVVGYFDDYKEKSAVILGGINDILDLFHQKVFDGLMVGIGYKHFDFRASIFEKFSEKIPFFNFIHSSCFVDKTVTLGEGVIVFPGCVIDQHVVLQNNVFVNVGCTIAHDTQIGAHTFLSPSVALAGFIKVGEKCNIGIQTTVIDHISIVDDVQTGGGTVVINDIKEKGLYVGNPQRFIR